MLEEGVDPARLLGARALDQVDRQPRRARVDPRRRGGLFEPLGDAGLLILAIGAAQVGAVDVRSGGIVGHLVSPETIRGTMPGPLNARRLRFKRRFCNGPLARRERCV